MNEESPPFLSKLVIIGAKPLNGEITKGTRGSRVPFTCKLKQTPYL